MAQDRRGFLASLSAAALIGSGMAPAARAADPDTLTLDWAYYNPLSLILRDRGILEERLKPRGIAVQWVQSLGSNKAVEFLNAGSIAFGSTAGAAALLGRVAGAPIRTVYVYSQPEWTALVTRPDTGIGKVADLKGRSVAVTKGTDPYVFLLRSLQGAGLSQSDVQLVLLQHDQGRLALERGDVDAWAGLDPMMAQSELEAGSLLFHRDPGLNSYGVLNVQEEFLTNSPDLVREVLAAYEQAREIAQAEPDALAGLLASVAKLSPEVAARQLERTGLNESWPEQRHVETIQGAGLALQEAGVIAADVDVAAATAALVDLQAIASLRGQG
ncbi:aliphatic sulfonate ABC transporter substrate-binding protein [Geminicoccus flavidas]|uniref:aliphatic sulfonate ABC transporter substrate-binding protein n=1 Tax=Geminicoccus flavidas TaxID=2506407 RepID=UPI00135A80A2|nr:aliphatic sulfonate ABC transporter substrate-binding protein [Geminicoccus flavidas]